LRVARDLVAHRMLGPWLVLPMLTVTRRGPEACGGPVSADLELDSTLARSRTARRVGGARIALNRPP
jgi:hypothetical protein